MTKKITLQRKISREALEKNIKTSFPDNYRHINLFGSIILDDGQECRTSINARGSIVKIRSYQPLWNLVLLPALGLLPRAAADTGRFVKMLEFRENTEQKYINWIEKQNNKS